jgi:hypothetical protein
MGMTDQNMDWSILRSLQGLVLLISHEPSLRPEALGKADGHIRSRFLPAWHESLVLRKTQPKNAANAAKALLRLKPKAYSQWFLMAFKIIRLL